MTGTCKLGTIGCYYFVFYCLILFECLNIILRHPFSGMILFSHLTDLNYFPRERNWRYLLDTVRTGQTLNVDVDCFSYFSLIFSYFIFQLESFLINEHQCLTNFCRRNLLQASRKIQKVGENLLVFTLSMHRN